jgi:hypothetical protein
MDKSKPCKPGKERNANGRCVKIKSIVDSVKSNSSKTIKLKPCKPGKERNANGRCVKIKSIVDSIKSNSSKTIKLKPCKPGKERNANGRCVKIKTTASKKTNKNKNKTKKTTPNTNEKNKAKEIIARFMLKNPTKRRSIFLKSICSDSGTCIAIGKEKNKIRQFFDDYTTFNYINSIDRIGVPSANGFVYEIKYSREDYDSYAVLKSAVEINSDNLFYEYLVGLKINETLNLRYPCFVETYGLFKYKNGSSHSQAKQNLMGTTDELRNIFLKDNLIKLPNDSHKIACEQSNNLALLIQHIHEPTTLDTLLRQQPKGIADNRIFDVELPFALFQIYYVLNLEKRNFTHYDLHLNNVLMFMPSNNKYIQYHYHMGSDVFSFKSKYMLKIIDYGRSYFNGSENIRRTLCNTTKCNPDCGKNFGFSWLDPRNKNNPYSHYISSTISNESHDLRLLSMLNKIYSTRASTMVKDYLQFILDKVQYSDEYGTKNNSALGGNLHINNVSDAFMKFKNLFLLLNQPDLIDRGSLDSVSLIYAIDFYEEISKYESLYAPDTKLGDLHVYDDGRNMTFTSA